MAMGRPPLFTTVEDFEKKVDEYFEFIKGLAEEKEVEDPDNSEEFIMETIWTRRPEPPTITGLCLFLGFESRQSFHDYQEKPDFTYAVKKARLRIESEYEKGLFGKSVVGSIFALKNMGWRDKQEVENTGTQKIEVVWDKTLLPPPNTD